MAESDGLNANSSRGWRHIIIVSGHVENCNDRQWASKSYATNQLRFEGYAVAVFAAPTSDARRTQTKEETGE